jgi:beta-glucosidase/6-phospho-beta-glucosidase/beta-galactosidase
VPLRRAGLAGRLSEPRLPGLLRRVRRHLRPPRHPHVRYWTPVNEILITALFSARYGWWNERLATDEAFVRATLNLCRAHVLAVDAIRRRIPDAVFVQSESCEYTHPARPDLFDRADFHNERRFLPPDLTYGRPVRPDVHAYLKAHGMAEEEYDFFMSRRVPSGCLLGTDYYVTNEHLLKPDGTTEASGEVLGYHAIARQYYERYRVPLVHTETNLAEKDGAAAWLWKQWRCLLRLRQDGVPVVGFTWYSLTDQMDWDTALREDARRVNPVGLFDLDRKAREVGRQFRRLVREWEPSLSAETAGGEARAAA